MAVRYDFVIPAYKTRLQYLRFAFSLYQRLYDCRCGHAYGAKRLPRRLFLALPCPGAGPALHIPHLTRAISLIRAARRYALRVGRSTCETTTGDILRILPVFWRHPLACSLVLALTACYLFFALLRAGSAFRMWARSLLGSCEEQHGSVPFTIPASPSAATRVHAPAGPWPLHLQLPSNQFYK